MSTHERIRISIKEVNDGNDPKVIIFSIAKAKRIVEKIREAASREMYQGQIMYFYAQFTNQVQDLERLIDVNRRQAEEKKNQGEIKELENYLKQARELLERYKKDNDIKE